MGDAGSIGGPSLDGHEGVFVNREAYYYSKAEIPSDCFMLFEMVSKDKLIDIYQVCHDKAFTYDLLSYNCTTFATECYYLLTGIDLRCNTPYGLIEKMKKQSNVVSGAYVTLQTDCFYSYYRSAVRFARYDPIEEES